MTEKLVPIRPQIALKPEGILEINIEYEDDDELSSRQDLVIDELLDSDWGVESRIEEDEQVVLTVEVERSFCNFRPPYPKEERYRIDEFLIKSALILARAIL